MRLYTSILLSSLLSIGLATQFQGGENLSKSFSQANSIKKVQVQTAPDLSPHRGSGRCA